MKKVLLLFAALVCIILSSCDSPNRNARLIEHFREIKPTDTCVMRNKIVYDCKVCLKFASQSNKIINDIDSVRTNLKKTNIAQAKEFYKNSLYNIKTEWLWRKHVIKCHYDKNEHNQYYGLQYYYRLIKEDTENALYRRIVLKEIE